MKIAIVGSSKIQDYECYGVVQEIINDKHPELIISGGAQGVDMVAYSIAHMNKIEFKLFPPKTHDWEGYKPRNILIAKNCDELINIVIKDKNAYCYHHKRKGHIKSGGCWTENYAKQLGKQVMVIEI